MFQKRDDTENSNLELVFPVASTAKSVVSARLRRASAVISAADEPMLAVVAAVSHAWRYDLHAISPHLKSTAISLVGGDLFAVDGDLIHKHLQPPVHPCPAPCTLSSLPLLPLACAPGLGVAHAPRHFGCARPVGPMPAHQRAAHTSCRQRARCLSLRRDNANHHNGRHRRRQEGGAPAVRLISVQK